MKKIDFLKNESWIDIKRENEEIKEIKKRLVQKEDNQSSTEENSAPKTAEKDPPQEEK